MSENIQSIAQNNYILQAPPPTATMFTTELEYDGDKISGYAGSAFKAGTDLEFGYDSADNISAINNSALTDVSLNNIVQTNSGSWGGSALPISAGPGIKVNLVDNTLVFSTVPNEKVLWSGAVSTTGVTCNMNDAFSSYNTIKVYSRIKTNSGDRSDSIREITWPEGSDHMYAYVPMDNIASNTHTEEVMYISATPSAFSLLGGWSLVGMTQTTGVTAYNFFINKIVGVN